MESASTRSTTSIVIILGLILVFFLGISWMIISFAGKPSLSLEKGRVGVVEITGVLADAKKTLKHLDRFHNQDYIKAIVLRINSPGGAVGPAQEILREVEKVRAKKKIVASLGTVAASGGYYVACGADKIVANPGTLTGSIGVIMKFTNVEDLVKKLGVDIFSLKAGKYKDVGTPFRLMTPEEKAYLQQLLEDVHKQFIKDISQGRQMPLDKVKAIADGRVFTGEEAKNLGLVDDFGNLEDAITLAGRLGGIKGKVEAVYPPKDKLSLWNILLGEDVEETCSRVFGTSAAPLYLYSPSQP